MPINRVSKTENVDMVDPKKQPNKSSNKRRLWNEFKAKRGKYAKNEWHQYKQFIFEWGEAYKDCWEGDYRRSCSEARWGKGYERHHPVEYKGEAVLEVATLSVDEFKDVMNESSESPESPESLESPEYLQFIAEWGEDAKGDWHQYQQFIFEWGEAYKDCWEGDYRRSCSEARWGKGYERHKR